MNTELLKVFEQRRTIRKFQGIEVPDDDLKKMVYYASLAPSACNDQNYKFVAIKNKNLIQKMANAVLEKLDEYKNMPEASDFNIPFPAKQKLGTVFANAPAVIAVFMTPFHYYDQEFLKLLKHKGLSDEEIMDLYSYPNIQSMGAAIENLILAAYSMGYGACWMSDPVIAKEKIAELVSAKKDERLIALIAIGKAAYEPKSIPKKSLEEIFYLVK